MRVSRPAGPPAGLVHCQYGDPMRGRRTLATALLGLGSVLAGCQWLVPQQAIPTEQPGPTLEGTTASPTLPVHQPSEASRLSPSLEIPPPVD